LFLNLLCYLERGETELSGIHDYLVTQLITMNLMPRKQIFWEKKLLWQN